MPDTWAQLSLGAATRFPTVGELFQAKFLSNSGTIDPKSFDPYLKPEVSTDISFMLRRQFGPFKVTSSFFYQDIENAIVSFTATTPNEDGIFLSGYQNIDLVTQYGVETIVEARDLFVEGLDVDFSVTRMDARTVRNIANPAAEGVMVPRVPEWRANGNIRYEISPKLKANLGWRYATRPNSDLFGLSRGDAYGFQTEYFVVDTRLNWEINDKVKFGFGIDNLNNDQSYVSHPMPQRTFVTDVKFSF
jgi:iron complex outermembrane receptor protein